MSGQHDMVRSTFENFKINKNYVVPVEFRFIRCKIIVKEQEYNTFEWMDSYLWKELIEETKAVFQTHIFINNLSAIEPTSITTPNLKLAFMVKDNTLKKSIFMVPNSSKTRLYDSLLYFDKMMVMSVSLNKNDIKLQDLYTGMNNENIKISSYFA